MSVIAIPVAATFAYAACGEVLQEVQELSMGVLTVEHLPNNSVE